MPFIEVNGAELYYETFGKDVPGRAPVVLIHGSTGTGQSNWRLVAPLLAREYFVIVPDCRGHGQSANPGQSYSFKELASDTAGLVRALGYERAHIVGHSNGGNVALVVLLEHPDVVQTAIPQAANAWVSPDLVEKEPGIFDPERVAREDPAWVEDMQARHAPTHGPDYWRDLLQMTVKEIISEPNYTPEDLRKVQRPTLVIQGEHDRVNAPYKHAQFIARYIPDAELWIPKGIGHNVHDELLFTWVERVLDFFKRRGDDDQEAVFRAGRPYADERDWVYQVSAAKTENGTRLTGQVLREEQRRAVREVFEGRAIQDEIQVLLDERTPWALVNRNVTDLRDATSRLSERHSQSLLGEAVRILEDAGEWVKVRLEEDGYLGWVKAAALQRGTQEDVQRYQAACTHLVAAGITPGYRDLDVKAAGVQLPFGVAVPVVEQQAGWCAVQYPDGSCWWAAETGLLSLEERPRPDADGIARTLAYLKRFTGIPYLWGGRTPYGFDCSGLAQAFLRFMGLRPKRDAGQQMEGGFAVTGEIQAGDLLFFGEAVEAMVLPGETADLSKHITHVAIALGKDDFIHSTGAVDGITTNSFDPASPVYSPWLKEHLAGVRRFT